MWDRHPACHSSSLVWDRHPACHSSSLVWDRHPCLSFFSYCTLIGWKDRRTVRPYDDRLEAYPTPHHFSSLRPRIKQITRILNYPVTYSCHSRSNQLQREGLTGLACYSCPLCCSKITSKLLSPSSVNRRSSLGACFQRDGPGPSPEGSVFPFSHLPKHPSRSAIRSAPIAN